MCALASAVMALTGSLCQAADPDASPSSDPLGIDTRLRTSAIGDSDDSGSDWGDFLDTGRSVLFQLGHPTGKEALIYAGLAVGAGFLQSHKYELANRVQAGRTEETNDLSALGRPLGEVVVPVAAFSTYLLGRFTGSESTRRAGLILSESALFTVAATEVSQFVLAEERPRSGGKLHFFRGGGHGVSGHASIIASTAVPIDRLFLRIEPDDGAWMRLAKGFGKTLAYGAPVLTGWSRMNDNQHYAWNVLLGLGTGYMMGELVMNAHEPRSSSRERSWSIVPMTNDTGAPGLSFRWSR